MMPDTRVIQVTSGFITHARAPRQHRSPGVFESAGPRGADDPNPSGREHEPTASGSEPPGNNPQARRKSGSAPAQSRRSGNRAGQATSGLLNPSAWRVQVPQLRLDLTVRPLLADQELGTTPRYWEGAVDVRGTRAGEALGGRGYVELVGYPQER